MQAFDSSDEIPRKATAEDLIRFTKPLTTATAKAVAAGNSCRQEDIIAASNLGRKCIFELFGVIKVSIIDMNPWACFVVLKSRKILAFGHMCTRLY